MPLTWTARDDYRLQTSLELIAMWERLLAKAANPGPGPHDSPKAISQYRRLIERERQDVAAMEARKNGRAA